MRIVSGIQPTGNLHLGNYLGAIRNWVAMQEDAAVTGGQCLYFLADLHAISQPHVPAELANNTREMTAALVACGVDAVGGGGLGRAILFNQAQVPQHAELQWLLNGTARMGWLNRMTQWKDKAGKNSEGASVALYTYPVLQAADVLLYQATHVPVGEDQKQHLELARDIAQKFNNDFATPENPTFTLPKPIIPGEAARIMSLRDGSAKMSKSDPSDMSRINLTDDADTILAKIKKAKSDADALPSERRASKAVPKPPTSWGSTPPWPASPSMPSSRTSAAKASAPSNRPSPNCWSKNWSPSTPASSPSCKTAPPSTPSSAKAPPAPASLPPPP